MSITWLLNTQPLQRFSKPVRDSAYLAFVRRFPCVGCGSSRLIEAAHFGPHGIGQKASDLDALPLCRACHREYHRSARTFAERKAIEVSELQEFFRGMYAKRRKAA
jgi:hypothetical protein